MNDNFQQNTKTLKSKGKSKSSPCPICGVIICNAYNLSCHLKRHSNVRPFKCEICGKGFIIKSELKRHNLCHSEKRPFECTICHKFFKDKISLRVHGDAHRTHNYRCRYCDKEFKEYRKFSAHEKQAHKDAVLKCRFCYKTFFSDLFKDEHERSAHLKLFNLSNSSRPVVTRKRGRGNRIDATPMVPLTLDFNSFAPQNIYGPKSGTIKRGASNENFKFYRCRVCSERFKYRKEQIAHYEKFHKEEYDKTFKVCNICGKLLTCNHYLAHMKVHDGNFNFACSYCDYKTMRRQDLQSHMRTHTKEFLHKCKTCDMPFRTSYQADICEKKHTGVKDVKCDECDRTFYTIRELKAHRTARHVVHKCFTCNFETSSTALLARHNKLEHNYEPVKATVEKKLLMCDKCGALFRSQSHLTYHLKRHIIDGVDWDSRLKKALVCLYCDYQGESSQDILRHCIEFHETKVHKCVFCSYTTLNTKLIKNHIKLHGDDIWQESYFHAKTEQQMEKDEDFVDFECFLCGYSSKFQGDMMIHSECHKTRMQKLTWVATENFESILYGKVYKGRKRTHLRAEHKIRKVDVQSVSENIDLNKYLSDFGSLESKNVLPGMQEDKETLNAAKEEPLHKEGTGIIVSISETAFQPSTPSYITKNRTSNDKLKSVFPKAMKELKTVSESSDCSKEKKHSPTGILKDKLDCRSINGKLFLSLDDVLSLSDLNVGINKEDILKLLKIEKKD